MGNAIKFTYKGYIKLIAEITTKHMCKTLKISVEDTGGGITQEDLNHLFTAFGKGKASKNPQGVGLGLMISKNIVELLGGEINVQSNYGVGTTFSFTLPLKENLLSEINSFSADLERKSNFYNARSMVKKRRTVRN
jgi:signal transduction histidine kinase